MADIKARILLRRGTAAEWTAANPVLLDGEPGWETDTGKLKIGDGETAWTALPEYSLDQEIAAIEAKANAAAAKASNLSDLTDKPQALVNLGVDATAEELNVLDGITASVAQLNALSSLPEIDGTVESITSLLGEKENADPEILKADTDDNLTAGYTSTAGNDGTKSAETYTPSPAGGNLKRIVNGGAFTLAAPTATGDYTMIIQMTNNASAGAITTSGFTKETGAIFTTTDGDDYLLHIVKINGFTALHVEALQYL